MRLNKSFYIVVTLLCVVSNYHSLSVSNLRPQELVEEGRSVCTSDHEPSVGLHSSTNLVDAAENDQAITEETARRGTLSYKGVKKLAEALGGELDFQFPQDYRIDLIQLSKSLKRKYFFSKKIDMLNVLKILEREEEYENHIAGVISQWDHMISSIREDLSPVELKIKMEIQEFISKSKLDPTEASKVFGPEYTTAIKNIEKNKGWELEHDPGYYFEELITQRALDEHELDGFIRARAIQMNQQKVKLEQTSFSKPDDIVPHLPLELSFERVFLGYIMMEGFDKILREMQKGATSTILKGLQEKITHPTEYLDPEPKDLEPLFSSNSKEDLEWLENLFAKVNPDGLKPSEIFIKLHGLNDDEKRHYLFNLYQFKLINFSTLEIWRKSLLKSPAQFWSTLGGQNEFTKKLIDQFKILKLDAIILKKKKTEGSKIFYKIGVLPHLATTYGEKLMMKSQPTYLKKRFFYSPFTIKFDEALTEFDPKRIENLIKGPINPKEIQKAFVETILKPFFTEPQGPLTKFLDEISSFENHVLMRYGSGMHEKLYDFNFILLEPALTPIKKGDKVLIGTKYENISQEALDNINHMAARLMRKMDYLNEILTELDRGKIEIHAFLQDLTPPQKLRLLLSLHKFIYKKNNSAAKKAFFIRLWYSFKNKISQFIQFLSLKFKKYQ